MGDDPYVILQVARHAEPEVIEAAYRRLARKYHPDVDSSPDANARMQKINWAYEILKDPVKRASYDRKSKQQQGYQRSYSQSGYGSPPPRSSSHTSSSSSAGTSSSSTGSSSGQRQSGTSQTNESGHSGTASTSSIPKSNRGVWIIAGLIAIIFLWNGLKDDDENTATPTPTYPKPTATTVSEEDYPQLEDDEAVLLLLEILIDDPRYDPSTQVLHKHLPYLDVELDSTSITFIAWSNFDPDEEFVSLGAELILIGAALLDPSDMFENRLTRIEVVSPGPENSSATLYVSGRSNITGIASGDLDVFDVMEVEVDWGDVSPTYVPTIDEGCPEGCTHQKAGCDIKGNISVNTGEKIYHVPGQEFYSQTTIRPEYGERWFCTEAEAIANGWRKSLK
jgi:hypothetical protein